MESARKRMSTAVVLVPCTLERYTSCRALRQRESSLVWLVLMTARSKHVVEAVLCERVESRACILGVDVLPIEARVDLHIEGAVG